MLVPAGSSDRLERHNIDSRRGRATAVGLGENHHASWATLRVERSKRAVWNHITSCFVETVGCSNPPSTRSPLSGKRPKSQRAYRLQRSGVRSFGKGDISLLYWDSQAADRRWRFLGSALAQVARPHGVVAPTPSMNLANCRKAR